MVRILALMKLQSTVVVGSVEIEFSGLLMLTEGCTRSSCERCPAQADGCFTNDVASLDKTLVGSNIMKIILINVDIAIYVKTTL